jgi:hypothetical protein
MRKKSTIEKLDPGATSERRIWIKLPNVPSELFDQAREGDDLEIVLARRQKLFSYFCASPETREGLEKLAYALAALVFPAFAFRPRREHPPGRPGRPPAARPKYEVAFLEKVARAHDRKKREIKSKNTISTKRLYEMFLKENPDFGKKLQVRGKPLKLSSFNKLLSVGRSACNYYVTWYKDALSGLPGNAKKSGEYLIMRLSGRAIHLGILRFRADSQLTCSTILVRADARC